MTILGGNITTQRIQQMQPSEAAIDNIPNTVDEQNQSVRAK